MYRRDIIDFGNLYSKYTHCELTWNDKIKNRMKVFLLWSNSCVNIYNKVDIIISNRKIGPSVYGVEKNSFSKNWSMGVKLFQL